MVIVQEHKYEGQNVDLIKGPDNQAEFSLRYSPMNC